MSEFAVLMMPFPPSVNHIWRSFRRSSGYTAWIKEADFQGMQQKPLPRFDGPVDVTIKLGRPDKRERDLDNLAKGILDRLEAWEVIENDNLVHRLSLEWSDDVIGAQIEIMTFSKEEIAA